MGRQKENQEKRHMEEVCKMLVERPLMELAEMEANIDSLQLQLTD